MEREWGLVIYVDLLVVILKQWKIRPPGRADSKGNTPTDEKFTYKEFQENEKVKGEIQRMSGQNLYDYLLRLTHGDIDYLPRLPKKNLLHICQLLELEDLLKLGQVSTKFRDLCNSDELWEKIYRANSETPITQELIYLAEDHGWKKLFYTNKLQLQMQLRRRAKKLNVDSKQTKRSK